MGTLTPFLQEQFEAICSPESGWTCQRECALFDAELEDLLGYSSRADVMLHSADASTRLWIEFEVSRADPVANHTKFATSHLFCPVAPRSAFVSMVSPHVTRGRRNLAAATIHLLRHVGIDAYQTTLFPHRSPDDIKRLNHLSMDELRAERLYVKRELDRAVAVSKPISTVTLETQSVRVHYAGELLEVMLSLRRFNADLETEPGRQAWGCRVVRYFVYDQKTTEFAPCKFCAYLPVVTRLNAASEPVDLLASREMSIELYSRIEAAARRFDGNLAWKHLRRNLGMTVHSAEELPELAERFARWLERHSGCVRVNPRGPDFLLPPAWF
jgi:hypothetical protein